MKNMNNVVGYFNGTLAQFDHYLKKTGVEGYWESSTINKQILTFTFINGGVLHWWSEEGDKSTMFVGCSPETIAQVCKTLTSLNPSAMQH
ncbi:hypothetical protein [Maridesulfovibrio sp.]|uniref:hypothetical protein n=1 Tax=unclassified Maridesulfovibrio TaxID=2794999 RepID=UPI003AFF649F